MGREVPEFDWTVYVLAATGPARGRATSTVATLGFSLALIALAAAYLIQRRGEARRRLEKDAPGVSGSILEGLDEILTVTRLGLPSELRRTLACTNAIENALGTVRSISRNVKRWRNPEIALRWTAVGMLEAQKTFRRLKAYRQLPLLTKVLEDHMQKAKKRIHPRHHQRGRIAS